MNSNGKRDSGSLWASIIASIGEESSSYSSGQTSKRQRQTQEFPTKSSFADLNDHYNFVVDVKDILEDYLTPVKKKDIRPLVLDTEEGEWETIAHHDHNGTPIAPGSCVMLKNRTFLRITKIFQEVDHDYIVLRGERLTKISRLRPILDSQESRTGKELLLDLQICRSNKTDVTNQGQVDVPIGWIERKVTIHFSNAKWSNDTLGNAYYCRWKLTRYYEDSKNQRKAVEVAIERLRQEEADPGFQIDDDTLRFDWRGDTAMGGSDHGNYTAMDGFCCGGGWSRGATMAGNIKIVRSFDLDPKACNTYGINFPETNCLNLDVFDYCLPDRLSGNLLEKATTPKHVDIGHYSTPCQFFSPAHTTVGANDETNFAASFCLVPLIQKDKPRVITFENTFGLERRHFQVLKPIFGQVTALNYSMRFTSLNLADYGLPQDRKRLVMLASCPGEPLPTFPAPTHSKDGYASGLQPWASIMDTISVIPFAGWQNHKPREMKKKLAPTKTKLLASTITCSGGTEVHPEGRLFTVCEFQLIQGFPLHHRFGKGLKRTDMIKQVGNAFPPIFVKQLLRHIRKGLQRVDGVPESIDADDFMSAEEIRAEEVQQFFRDHERLPQGVRANIMVADDEEADGEADDEDDEEETNGADESDSDDVIVVNKDVAGKREGHWSWITSKPDKARRRESDNSTSSGTSSSSTSQITTSTLRDNSSSPQDSLEELYNQLGRNPRSLHEASLSRQSFQFLGRRMGTGYSASSTSASSRLEMSIQKQYDQLGQDPKPLVDRRKSSMLRPSIPARRHQGSSSDDPIEL